MNFVEEQPFVDYVTDFQLFHETAGITSEAEASKAVSILVSAPEHCVQVIKPAEAGPFGPDCQCEI